MDSLELDTHAEQFVQSLRLVCSSGQSVTWFFDMEGCVLLGGLLHLE